MPLYDVQHEYLRELTKIRHAKYRALLKPYVKECLSHLPTPSGLVANLGTQMSAEREAVKHLYDATGITPEEGALPGITDRLLTSLINSRSIHS